MTSDEGRAQILLLEFARLISALADWVRSASAVDWSRVSTSTKEELEQVIQGLEAIADRIG